MYVRSLVFVFVCPSHTHVGRASERMTVSIMYNVLIHMYHRMESGGGGGGGSRSSIVHILSNSDSRRWPHSQSVTNNWGEEQQATIIVPAGSTWALRGDLRETDVLYLTMEPTVFGKHLAMCVWCPSTSALRGDLRETDILFNCKHLISLRCT